MRRSLVLLALAASACGGSRDEQQLGPVSFEIAASWQRTDTHGRGTATAMFTPSTNSRKESITVIRTEIGPIATKYTPGFLMNLLTGANASLAQAKMSPVASLSTPRGLSGMRVEVDYVPPGRTAHYHRVHAVLTDGTALIHVLYTAATPDPELALFEQVVNSLHEES